jgi:hypothetical protein
MASVGVGSGGHIVRPERRLRKALYVGSIGFSVQLVYVAHDLFASHTGDFHDKCVNISVGMGKSGSRAMVGSGVSNENVLLCCAMDSVVVADPKQSLLLDGSELGSLIKRLAANGDILLIHLSAVSHVLFQVRNDRDIDFAFFIYTILQCQHIHSPFL